MTENKSIFQVGQTYQTRGGKKAKVLYKLDANQWWVARYTLLCVYSDGSNFWTADEKGITLRDKLSPCDLLPPEKPTTPFEVGKVYKANNGLYYKVVRIEEDCAEDNDKYPIIADCVGDDEEGSFEVDGFSYEQESFTLDGIFLLDSLDKEDDLIPTPVAWPPVKKPVNTPFEVGKYYRNREGYYFQVVSVGDRVKVKSVGWPNGEPIPIPPVTRPSVHEWYSDHTPDGLYDETNPGTNEDLLPTPVVWPIPQQETPEPHSSTPEKTPDQNPPPKVQPLPNSSYLLVDLYWYGTPEMREDEMAEMPDDPKEIHIRRVLPLPNNVFLVEVVKKTTAGKECIEWKHWDDATGGMVPNLLTQP